LMLGAGGGKPHWDTEGFNGKKGKRLCNLNRLGAEWSVFGWGALGWATHASFPKGRGDGKE